ncbi:hypothetical protein TrRE_jg4368 [Triparma retinervis]|uniref:Selenoprotein H n=1 Tax=Triparma retinervis TaxID=2557542 RepID=A0A9W6ZTU5_9STRA|nr:hypothetical protein TrRE_jg4368 [Triparma retinervis]
MAKTSSPKKKAAKPAAKAKASTKKASTGSSSSLPFKTRAAKVEKGLSGIAKVVINAEKPNKGAFVITIESSGKKVVALTGLKRPFPKLKALDMDEVVEDCKSKL